MSLTYMSDSSGENASPLGWMMASLATDSSPVSGSKRNTKQPACSWGAGVPSSGRMMP